MTDPDIQAQAEALAGPHADDCPAYGAKWGECDCSRGVRFEAIAAALQQARQQRDAEWVKALEPLNTDTDLGRYLSAPVSAAMYLAEKLKLAEEQARQAGAEEEREAIAAWAEEQPTSVRLRFAAKAIRARGSRAEEEVGRG